MSESNSFIPPLENLAAQFRKLPGVGKKSAYRMAFAVLDFSDTEAKAFSDAITAAKKNITKRQNLMHYEFVDVTKVWRGKSWEIKNKPPMLL